MRDLIVLVLLVVSCLLALRRPWLGAVIGTGVSLGSPHLQFGYAAAGWPVGLAISACTVVGLLVTKERRNPFGNAAVGMTIALAVWMTIAEVFALEPDLSYWLWERSMKIFLLLYLALALIDSRKKLDAFIWANVIAIGYYGVKGGLFGILTGGQFIVVGPGGFIGGNNELALAEIVVLPFMRYLQQQSANKWLRRALGVSMALMAVSIVVSHSRGALVGLVAMMSFFWLKNDNKFRWGVLILIGAVIGAFAMPAEYWNRMDTIATYQEDTSAQGRINSWWLAWNLATDRITGGGCTLTVPWIFAKYAPNPQMILVAHSIYFQMMGEQGFIGLGIFLLIGFLTWVNASRMISRGKADPSLKWAAQLGAMIHASMVGYAVSGAFLSLAYFDLPYNVMAMSALGLHLAVRRIPIAPTAPAEAPKPLPAGRVPRASTRPNLSRKV